MLHKQNAMLITALVLYHCGKSGFALVCSRSRERQNPMSWECPMNLLKFVAILAAITVPFLLLQEKEQAPQIVESDEIFDEELSIN
jgi:hypothetical protein